MTYHSDPTRWTQSPGEAPELLRGGLEAANREGPSQLQMRALALKLAAVGTGAALAAGAAGAKASSTAAGAGIAATGSSMLTKVVVSVALIGAAATGGTLLMRQRSQVALQPAPSVAATFEAAPREVEPGEPVVTARSPSIAPVAAPGVVRNKRASSPQAVAPSEAAIAAGASIVAEDAPAEKSERRERHHARASAAVEQHQASTESVNSRSVPAIKQASGEQPQLSEIDLLTKARSALAARPREAYRLTEEHRELYPTGVFAQERDALAVEALQRAGDAKRARERAEAFLARYPSSPAAHRFRETMNLP